VSFFFNYLWTNGCVNWYLHKTQRKNSWLSTRVYCSINSCSYYMWTYIDGEGCDAELLMNKRLLLNNVELDASRNPRMLVGNTLWGKQVKKKFKSWIDNFRNLRTRTRILSDTNQLTKPWQVHFSNQYKNLIHWFTKID